MSRSRQEVRCTRSAFLRYVAVGSPARAEFTVSMYRTDCPNKQLPFLLPGLACTLPSTLVVPGLGLEIARTAVVTNAAAGAVPAIAPGTGLNWTPVPAAEPLSGRRNFEAQLATLVAVPGPPAAAQNGTSVPLAQPLPGRWHFSGSVAFRAARIAMARAPIAGPDRPAVNLTQPCLRTTAALSLGSLGVHALSILQFRAQKTVLRYARTWHSSARDKNRAFLWLGKAYAVKCTFMTTLKYWTVFDPIRSEPAFHRFGSPRRPAVVDRLATSRSDS